MYLNMKDIVFSKQVLQFKNELRSAEKPTGFSWLISFTVMLISFIGFLIGIVHFGYELSGIFGFEKNAQIPLVYSVVLMLQPIAMLMFVTLINEYLCFCRVMRLLKVKLAPLAVIKRISSAPALFEINDSSEQALKQYLNIYEVKKEA